MPLPSDSWSFQRTAEELKRLRMRGLPTQWPTARSLKACVEVLSVDNQAWMTQWTRTQHVTHARVHRNYPLFVRCAVIGHQAA
jgi:hypothetical protein